MESLETDLTVPCIVFAIDPGVSTGYSALLFTETEVKLLGTGFMPDPDSVWKEIHATARNLRSKYAVKVLLVVEQFDKRPGVVNPDFTAKYVSRDIENNIYDFPIYWQIPAAAMNLVKPGRKGGRDQLKRFADWYKTNNVHGNDATRHAIVFGVEKLKHRPLILMGWPKPKDDDEDR